VEGLQACECALLLFILALLDDNCVELVTIKPLRGADESLAQKKTLLGRVFNQFKGRSV